MASVRKVIWDTVPYGWDPTRGSSGGPVQTAGSYIFVKHIFVKEHIYASLLDIQL